MTTHTSRYRSGGHEAVWNELREAVAHGDFRGSR